MGRIYNIFSEKEAPPSTHSVKTANLILPLILKYTSEAVGKTATLSMKMDDLPANSRDFQKMVKEFDSAIEKWVDRIHRLGAVAKGLWLVDFDTGDGYLCWSYPERRVEYFHSYDTGFKNRKKIEETPFPSTSSKPSKA
ncbi:MAG: hypothetical protein JWQ35_743 [Bacteriovoracaceae bacterium]|nr:hypothetical protein [Bacteriovoracaceae bacterium]